MLLDPDAKLASVAEPVPFELFEVDREVLSVVYRGQVPDTAYSINSALSASLSKAKYRSVSDRTSTRL